MIIIINPSGNPAFEILQNKNNICDKKIILV